MRNKPICILAILIMLFAGMQTGAFAKDYTYNAADYLSGGFEELTVGSITAASLLSDEADSMEITVNLDEYAMYNVSFTGIMSFDDTLKTCSPMSYSIDNGDKIAISSDNFTKKSTLTQKWMGMAFTVYESNISVVLPAGEHTLTIYVDEPRPADESYYVCAVSDIIFTGTEIKTSFTFDGFGDDFQKYNSDGAYSGNYYGQYYSSKPGYRSVDFTIGQAGWYDMETSVIANLSGTNKYTSPMHYAVDGGEKIKMTDDNFVHTGIITARWANAGFNCEVVALSEPLYLEEGVHNITFYVDSPNLSTGVTHVAAIDYITVSLAKAKDIVLQSNGEFNNYCESDFTVDVITSDSTDISININGTDYSAFTDAQLSDEFIGNGMKKLRLNDIIHLSEGTNVVKVSGSFESIALRTVRNISGITADSVVVGVGDEANLEIKDADGNVIKADDLFSYSFESSSPEIASMNGFAAVSAKRSGKSDVLVRITVNIGEAPVELTVPVYAVRSSGVYVKNAELSGTTLNITVGSSAVAGDVNVLAGRRNKAVLSGFNEVKLLNCGSILQNGEKTVSHSFSELSENEEIVIFIVDSAFNHLYGKTVIR